MDCRLWNSHAEASPSVSERCYQRAHSSQFLPLFVWPNSRAAFILWRRCAAPVLCPRNMRMRFLRRWKTRIPLFFAVVGPGFITANVDNDAGGILTYSSAGAQFGHLLLWTIIPITVALIVVQEMCARMGAVTGKGLSDLIREEFGLRLTFFMMLGILIT